MISSISVNDVKNVEKTAIIILRNRLRAAIESEMSDEETEEHLKDWCYYHVISHKRKDLKNFVRKVKMKHEITNAIQKTHSIRCTNANVG